MKTHILMILVTAFVSTTAVYADDFGSGANEFEIEFALMGNAGNAADSGGYGDVGYNYKIGRYEVTVEQFSKAWNLDNRISNNDENHWEPALGDWAPAVNVSWQEAAKFCNWLTSGDAYAGAYTVSGGVVTGVDRVSAVAAYGLVYVIPTEDEWYKAAYQTGTGYSMYANGTDTIPEKGPGGANYDYYYPTPGKPWLAWEGAGEHNATHNMNGNVWEICEGGADLLIRGGAFDEPPRDRKDGADHFFQAIEIGFRVAAISSVMVGEDDFDDSSVDSLKWNAIWSDPNADFIESGGRLNHTNNPSSGGTFEAWHWVASSLSYTQNWVLAMDVANAISPSSLSADQSIDFGLGVEIGDYLFVIEHRVLPSGYEFYTKAGDIPSDQVFFGNGESTSANTATLALTFNAEEQMLFSSYMIGDENFPLEHVSTSNWGMNGSSSFIPLIHLDNSSVPVSLGQLSIDNFQLYLGEAMNIDRAVENMGITKTRLFDQTDASTTAPAGATFYAWVSGDYLTAYYPSGPVNFAGPGGVVSMPFIGNKRWWDADYVSVAAMNTALPNGTYTLNLSGTNVTLNLSPESYPIIPVCSSTAGSWSGGKLQVSVSDAANGLMLSANDGDSASGFLSIQLYDADYTVDIEVFETHWDSSDISLSIPPGELEPGKSYIVEVEFDNGVDNADADHIDPGAWSHALYSSRTTFEIEVVDLGVAAPIPFTEDFSAVTFNPFRWKPVIADNGGSLQAGSGMVKYVTGPVANDNWVHLPWNGPLPVDKDWVATLDVHNLHEPVVFEHNSSVGLQLLQPQSGEEFLFNELGVWNDEGTLERSVLTSLETGEIFYGEAEVSLPGITSTQVRMAFAASNKVVETFIDPDGAGPLDFQSLATFGLGGSGGATGNRDWNLSSTNRFELSISAGSEPGGIVPVDVLWADNFNLIIEEFEAPALSIVPSASGLEFSWPEADGGFQLEYKDSLTNDTWISMGDLPASTGTNQTITLPASASGGYYRLSY